MTARAVDNQGSGPGGGRLDTDGLARPQQPSGRRAGDVRARPADHRRHGLLAEHARPQPDPGPQSQARRRRLRPRVLRAVARPDRHRAAVRRHGLLDLAQPDPRAGDGRRRRLLNSLVSRQVDGIIWAIPQVGDNRVWSPARRPDSRCRWCSSGAWTASAAPSIGIDNRAIGRMATEHLLAAGRGASGSSPVRSRGGRPSNGQLGWRETLADRGPGRERLVVKGTGRRTAARGRCTRCSTSAGRRRGLRVERPDGPWRPARGAPARPARAGGPVRRRRRQHRRGVALLAVADDGGSAPARRGRVRGRGDGSVDPTCGFKT